MLGAMHRQLRHTLYLALSAIVLLDACGDAGAGGDGSAPDTWSTPDALAIDPEIDAASEIEIDATDVPEIDAASDAEIDAADGPPDDADMPPAGCDPVPDHWPEPTAELFVSPDGSDLDGDGSEAAPYGNVEHAASLATAGTAVRLLPGTYPGGIFLSDLTGTAAAPIIVGGVPGSELPVIDAAGQSEGLHLIRARHVVIEHLVVQGASDNGVNADDGGAYDDEDATRFVLFREITVQDIGPTGNHDCLKLSGLDDFVIDGCTFRRCGSGGSGVDMVGCHDGLIARSHFSELGSSGVQAKGGTTDVTVWACHFEHAGARPLNMGGSTGLQFFRPPVSDTEPNAEARRIHAVANVIVGGEAAAAFTGCVDCVFAHNTLLGSRKWVLRILQETTTANAGVPFDAVQGGQVVNNLVSFQASALSTTVNVGPNTESDTFTFSHNLWWAGDDPGQSAPSLPSDESGALVGEDPMADADGGIPGGSPAAGAGAPAGMAWVTSDHAGACYASPPSVGAFEVQ